MQPLVLAIGAHPDDIEFGCGGRLMQLKLLGYRLMLVVVTSGEQGAAKTAPRRLALIRENEARVAAKILGAEKIIFLREPDGFLVPRKETKLRLLDIIRRTQPEIVFTHSRFDQHQDHRVVHSLSMDALQGASGAWFPQIKRPAHKVEKIFGYEVWSALSEPQAVFPIDQVMRKKIRALQAHRSQIMHVDYSQAAVGLAKYRGAMAGVGKYAEAFEVLLIRA